jgi:hypothetical protein
MHMAAPRTRDRRQTQEAPSILVEASERVVRAGDSVGKTTFATRALNAVARLTESLDERVLSEAAAAPTDYGVLLRALEVPAAQVVLRGDQPFAAARLRGLRYRQRLLDAEGGTLSASQVAGQLGITRQAVDKRRRAGRLLGLAIGRRGYAYPAWQLDERHGTLPGLEAVLSALSDHDPWMRQVFMLTGNTRLAARSPLEMLRSGEIDEVVLAARAFGEHGAA